MIFIYLIIAIYFIGCIANLFFMRWCNRREKRGSILFTAIEESWIIIVFSWLAFVLMVWYYVNEKQLLKPFISKYNNYYTSAENKFHSLIEKYRVWFEGK